MTKKKVIVIAIGIVATLGVVGGAILGYKEYVANTREVEVQPVSYINWGYWGDTETSYGMVTNDSAQEIYLTDSMKIQNVYVQQGDVVKVGDPLLAYDTSELQINIQRKKLDINTTENDIVQAMHKLNALKNATPVDKTPPQMDEDKFEELAGQDKIYNSITEKDAKDNRIYNYLTKDAIPSSGAGTQDAPYIYYVNTNAYAYGSFFNGIRPSTTDLDGVSVRLIVPKKNVNGMMETDASGTPIPDTSLTIYQKDFNGAQIPAEYDADKMWYVFTGLERSPSDLAGDYRDDYLNELEDWSEPEGYTQHELVQAIADTEKRLKDLDISRRKQLLELESMQKTASDGVLYAEVAGEVKTLGDPDNPPQDGTAFLVVAGNDGLYVSGTISELLLGDVTVGTVVTANSWESGMSFEATITEISDYPVSSNSWGEGNPNVSYYAYTAYIEDSTALRNGEYVDLSISTNQSEDGGGIYIDKAYVREEDGKSYCMIADENGRLKKQYIVTGKTVYGSAIEVKSGITDEDLIAFPYGKDVVEGAKAVEASNMYY
ncbi:MAG: biotin/lipoyl-binding protein [Agathobacter sp.]|nr:biotin/lipoyl-binding protein [Agathobacter sp.]